MGLAEVPSSLLYDPEALRKQFEIAEVVYSRQGVGPYVCTQNAKHCLEDHLMPLPTDDGDVYELYDQAIPSELGSVGLSLCVSIAKAAQQALNADKPYEAEMLRYRNGAKLNMHRDTEGHGPTKVIVTLTGAGQLLTDHGEVTMRSADVVLLRGSEFIGQEELTPLHGTKRNMQRRLLLVQPNFA